MNHDVKYNTILPNYCKLLGYNGISWDSNHEWREGGPGLWTWICWGYLLQAMGQLDMIWVSLKWWMGSAFTGPKRSKNLPLAATGKTVKLKTQGHMMVSTPLKSMTSSVGIILPNIWKVINSCSKPPTRLDTIYIRYHLHYGHYGFLDGLFWKTLLMDTNGILDTSHFLVLHGYPIGWIRGRSSCSIKW